MRVALVTETFCPSVDSSTRTAKAVIDRLLDVGHEVRVVTPGPGLATYRGASISRTRPLDPIGGQVRAAIDEFRPDVALVLSPGTVGRKALKHTTRRSIPSVVVEQSPLLHQAADYWRTRVAERADRVLVTSRWMVDRAAELGVSADLWHPGVDTAAFTPGLRDEWLHTSWSRHGSRVVVGYVGGLHKRHGVRRLAQLSSVRGIRPVIIGDGPQRAWLESRLPGAVFTGTLATGDLTVALPSLDVLVHPGEHETCAHSLREAAASGVPVVAPRSGGAPDVVRNLESGLLYDRADRGGLVRAVDAIAADSFRCLLGDRARELASTRTWTFAADDLISVLLESATRSARVEVLTRSR
ncbi:glycosyltransferase family 1 protein [Nocardioides salsibiostraticola]